MPGPDPAALQLPQMSGAGEFAGRYAIKAAAHLFERRSSRYVARSAERLRTSVVGLPL